MTYYAGTHGVPGEPTQYLGPRAQLVEHKAQALRFATRAEAEEEACRLIGGWVEAKGEWPDPSRPGVPLTPQERAPHWLSRPDEPGRLIVLYWNPSTVGWLAFGPAVTVAEWEYHGPVLTPSVLAQQEAKWAAKVEAARREGAEAMRERCTQVISQHADALGDLIRTGLPGSIAAMYGDKISTLRNAETAIRTLPTPPPEVQS